MTTEQKTFIEEIAAAVKKYAPDYDIKVYSPIIAQAINESGWGKSSLAAKYHNYFGMKCGSAWKGKSVNMTTHEEYAVGTLTTIKDNFRVYDSLDEGVKGYFNFISASRYANLKGVTDPETYLKNIKADGYATSSTYVSNLMSLIKSYSLTDYDGGSPASDSSEASAEASATQTGGKTNAPNSSAKTHTVVSGDTNSALAAKYGTTVTNIVANNKGKYPTITANHIEIGWVLDVSSETSVSASTGTSRMHTVVKGDTTSALAVKYGTTIAKIVANNKSKYPKITANHIEIGWTLKV